LSQANRANGTLLGSEPFDDFSDLFPSTHKLQITAREEVAAQNVRSKPPAGDACRSAMQVFSLIKQVSRGAARLVKSAITTSKNGKKQPTFHGFLVSAEIWLSWLDRLPRATVEL
jgi:hypothetical protein